MLWSHRNMICNECKSHLCQVNRKLQHRPEEGQEPLRHGAQPLDDEDEGGEDRAAQHVVVGGLLPQRGQVVQQGGADGPDGHAHPLYQVAQHVENIELSVALPHLLQQREEEGEHLLQVGLQLLHGELKVVNDHLHGLGGGQSDHKVLVVGQHRHQHLVQPRPQLGGQLDPAPLAHEPAHAAPHDAVVALAHAQLQRQGARQPAVEVNLVVEIECRQTHGVVDGVLVQDGGQVGGVHGGVVVADEGDEQRRQDLPVLVEEGEEDGLAARPPAVLPAVPALLAGEPLGILVPKLQVVAGERQVVGDELGADLLDGLGSEELLLDGVGLEGEGVPGVLNILGWSIFHA